MLIQLLVQCFVDFLCNVVSNLPDLPLLSFISDSLQLAQWIAWANYYLPLEDFVIGTFAVLSFWAGSAVLRIVIDLL